MQITRDSLLTGITRTRELDITEEQINNWIKGMLVQDAFPHLSADDREFIQTGITAEEWEKEFGKTEK